MKVIVFLRQVDSSSSVDHIRSDLHIGYMNVAKMQSELYVLWANDKSVLPLPRTH